MKEDIKKLLIEKIEKDQLVLTALNLQYSRYRLDNGIPLGVTAEILLSGAFTRMEADLLRDETRIEKINFCA